MIFSHFKIGFRSLLKRKGFFLLNAGGLTVGLTAVLLIGLWVQSELSFNQSLTNYKTIASVMQHETYAGEINTYSGLPMQLAPVLRKEYGDYFKHIVTSSRMRNYNMNHNGKMQMVRGRFAEPDFVHILDLEMIAGNKEALNDISSTLISESTAKNLFGTEDPIGKTIKLNARLDVKVAGIYKDLPRNSSFGALKFIAPWELLKKSQNYEKRLGWGNYWFEVFVQMRDANFLDNVSARIEEVFNDNYSYEAADHKLFLFPISKWHLHSKFENGVAAGGRIESVRTFSIIGLFILLLACINFMNLSTANSLKRSKEVGIRKTLGSARKQLIFQFFTESFLIILFSFVVALIFTFVLLPQYNTITLKDITIPIGSPVFWFICLGLIVVTAVFSSLYPSIYLSAFNPVRVLKGLSSNNRTAVNLRKVLVVVQFAISGILIMSTLTIIRQIDHAKDRPLGFDKDLLVSVPINNNKVLRSFDVIKSELLQSTFIKQVTGSDVKVTSAYTTNGGSFDWKNKDPKLTPQFHTIRATLGFGEMIDWNVLQGRDFSADFPSDSLAFLINEKAMKYMGLKNPVGEYVRWGENNYKIIGVVEDMVTRSPYDPITPSLFILHKGSFLNYVNIKIASSSTGVVSGAIDKIRKVFLKHDPENIFRYSFLDEEYERKFNEEERVAKLVGWFSLVAIFISCLGVLGLSTYMAVQRRKEIGVRKVLGASVLTIWRLLSKQFLTLILISVIIGLPIGYHFSSEWLSEYSYRTTIDIWIFALSGGFILMITLLTVSYQAIKSATSNPVNSIRTE